MNAPGRFTFFRLTGKKIFSNFYKNVLKMCEQLFRTDGPHFANGLQAQAFFYGGLLLKY
jgi:hypothetical protein